MDTRDILRKAKKLLKENGWIQGAFYREDSFYNPDSSKCTHCLVGAIGRVVNDQPMPQGGEIDSRPEVVRALKKLGFKTWTQASDWSEKPGRTIKQVLNRFKGKV